MRKVAIHAIFLTQSQDASNQLIGTMAEFERNLIRERVITGQQRAKANGIKLGRPSKINHGMKNAITLPRDKGMGIKQIAK